MAQEQLKGGDSDSDLLWGRVDLVIVSRGDLRDRECAEIVCDPTWDEIARARAFAAGPNRSI